MATHLLSFPLLIFLPQSKAPNPRKHRSYRLSQPSPFVINVTHSMCLELAQWMSGNREKIWWVYACFREKIWAVLLVPGKRSIRRVLVTGNKSICFCLYQRRKEDPVTFISISFLYSAMASIRCPSSSRCSESTLFTCT